jgi:hypothetical protein
MKESLSSSETSVLTKVTRITPQKTPFFSSLTQLYSIAFFRRNLIVITMGFLLLSIVVLGV